MIESRPVVSSLGSGPTPDVLSPEKISEIRDEFSRQPIDKRDWRDARAFGLITTVERLRADLAAARSLLRDTTRRWEPTFEQAQWIENAQANLADRTPNNLPRRPFGARDYRVLAEILAARSAAPIPAKRAE